MNRQLRDFAEKLRSMSSEDAAAWLTKIYPLDSIYYGNAFIIMPHRSWRKSDQIRLARYYLRKIPFASEKPYEAFTSFMAISNFVKVVKEYIPVDHSDRMLLKYHLEGVLNKGIKSGSDEETVRNFIDELDQSPHPD